MLPQAAPAEGRPERGRAAWINRAKRSFAARPLYSPEGARPRPRASGPPREPRPAQEPDLYPD
jgi:hypothetical protein